MYMILEKSTIPCYIPLYADLHVAFGQIPQGKETIDQLFDTLILEHRFGTVCVLPIISIADCPEYGRCWHDAIATAMVYVGVTHIQSITVFPVLSGLV